MKFSKLRISAPKGNLIDVLSHAVRLCLPIHHRNTFSLNEVTHICSSFDSRSNHKLIIRKIELSVSNGLQGEDSIKLGHETMQLVSIIFFTILQYKN